MSGSAEKDIVEAPLQIIVPKKIECSTAHLSEAFFMK
jgi:hypothetical protein